MLECREHEQSTIAALEARSERKSHGIESRLKLARTNTLMGKGEEESTSSLAQACVKSA